MGIKEADRKPRSVPTGDQLRLAKLTSDSAVDEDQEVMKRLIKKVIETTLCTKAQAEIALFDNDNDVDGAVLQILENPDLDWTEQKNRKEKKKEDEYVKPARGQSSTRGRKEWSDRQNGGRTERKLEQGSTRHVSSTARGSSRGAAQNGRGNGRVHGNGSRPQPRAPNTENKFPTENGDHEEVNDWKSGPLVFKRSEDTAPTTTDSVTSLPTAPLTNGSSAGPISFAAVAAAGANKEKQRQQQKLILHTEEIKPSVSVEEVAKEHVNNEPEAETSVNTCVPVEEESLELNQPSTATEWANKIKSDLGIGVTAAESFAPEPINAVEFVSDGAPSYSSLQEYQFGFNSEPTESLLPNSPPQPVPVVQMPEAPLFTRSPIISSSSQPMPTKNEAHSSQNGEFTGMKTSPPNVPASSYVQQMPGPRAFSYDSSSVSYAPPDSRTVMNKPQPPTTQQMNVQNPPPQAHQQPQQMTYAAPQMPYGNYPYLQNVNMYSPLRSEDAGFAAAALMQYPFGMGGQIDLGQLLPQGTLAAGQGQQVPQQQHRNDNQQMMEINKFQGGVNSARESVAPPPGFPATNYMPAHPQPNLQNLFLQQQYAPNGPFPYMMQPAVNQGRQMYAGGDDDRKTYDRNAGKQAGLQQTPPPHFPHNGYMQGLGKPKPQQNYGHSGWNS